MLRPGEENRLEEGINYFPAGAPRRTLFFTLAASGPAGPGRPRGPGPGDSEEVSEAGPGAPDSEAI